MQNLSKMTSVYGYVCLYLVIIVSTTATSNNTVYKHNITCGEVSQASCNLTKILKELNNDTHVSLTSGKYYLRNNIELANIHHVLISGASRNSVFIECSGDDIGISFVRSNNVRIKGLTISKCGAPHIGTSLYNFTFLAALHFVYCRDIEFYDVSVSYNSALGVNLYDVGGKVKFVASEFTSNEVVPGKDMLLPIVPARWAGGGIYVQFTYCGSMYGNGCTDSDDIEHQKYIHHNNYIFQDCIFSRNYAPEPPQLPDTKNTDFLPPQKTDHMSLGRGGGLSLYLRGNASHNSFLIYNCSFIDNYAIWGGGFFTEFADSCFQNEVVITKSLFTGNKAKWAGGGMRYGLIQVFSDMQPYNNGTFMNITFEQNSALWGGATSVYATEEVLTKDRRASSQIHFSGVTWINNTASNGAAVGGASWKILSAGGVIVPVFKDTLFKNNHIFDYRSENQNTSSNFSYSVINGQGTICTNAMPFYFEGKNQFLDNFGTVFLMVDAVLTAAAGTMEFVRNQGHDGGGISLLGQSWININPGSNFLFSKNTAVRGAGIFVHNPGTPNRVASRNCFITYNAPTTLETLVSPEKWKTFFNFSYNNATVSGHSIYSSTLKYCGWYMEVYGFHDRQLFNWSNFVYENVSPLVGNEIATDPVEISLHKEDWVDLSPSDITNPAVKLIDERNQVIAGIVNIKIQNTNMSNAQVDVSSGPFFPAKDNIYSFKLSGKENVPFSLSIQTVTGRIVKAIIPKVTLQDCRPGYRLQGNSKCVCLRSPQESTDDSGITRCQGDRHVFIRKGLWAGTIDGTSETFVTSPCPPRYCNYRCLPNMFCAPHEYLYLEEADRQCDGDRTGVLCGKCRPGYSVVLGSDGCESCPKGYAWVGYFSFFLIAGTLVVIAVLLVNVDISTGQYTGCLFFYQVVLLLVRDGFEPDPVLSFLMGLANAQVGVGACMWNGMTDLQKLGLTYVLPAYILFLCIVVIILSRFPSCVFSRRSALRAFTTLFLVSYTTFTSVSLELLHFTTLHGKTVLYKSGEVEYFKGEHVGYGILAIIVCAVIVIPFPLCLCLVQPLSYLKPGLGGGKLKPFLDIFQYCYQTRYRWFSGVYYLARIVLLLIYIFTTDSTLMHGLLCVSCIMLLTFQTNIRPYGTTKHDNDPQTIEPYGTINHENDPPNKGTWLNLLDSLILMDLALIALLGSFSASSDSALTLIDSREYSVADYLCIFLMWLPAPYFIGVIGLNSYRGAKKKIERIQKSSNDSHCSVMTETSGDPNSVS